MKRGLLASYVAGIRDFTNGESYGTILRYFYPEFITALLLYSLPLWLDAAFISYLRSTPSYATLGTVNTLLHVIVKIAEAVGVGTVIISGQFNGTQEVKNVGRTIRDAFWVTCITGTIIACMLYFGAYWIYYWCGVSKEIIYLGIPFLRMRALGIFFMFVYFAFIGFLRSIKNTKLPMQVFIVGALVFIFFDYGLIFGAYGLPEMGFNGSALASVLQYAVMLVLVMICVLGDKRNSKYGIELFSVFKRPSYFKDLLLVSWPIALDKAILAASYLWLCKMIAPLGTCAVAAFSVVKDMERFAFLPAIAFAQVVTFLVSNDFSNQRWDNIKSNVKKITFLASSMVFVALLCMSIRPEYIIYLFDKKGDFTPLAAQVFPILGVLVFFDVLQLILSGALRGAANVKIVMMVRVIVCLAYFMPISYLLSHLSIDDVTLKFVLIYGSFYIGNALMSIIYINRFRSDDWKMQPVQEEL